MSSRKAHLQALRLMLAAPAVSAFAGHCEQTSPGLVEATVWFRYWPIGHGLQSPVEPMRAP